MEKSIVTKKAIIVFILIAICIFLFSEMTFLNKESKRLEQLEKVYGVEVKKPSTEE